MAVSVHAVLGLALIVIALSTAVRAGVIRHGGIIALAVAGLVALTSAAIDGTRFAGTGKNGASVAMALAVVVGLLCYLSIMYIAGRPARR